MDPKVLDDMLGLAVTTVLRRAGLLTEHERMQVVLWKDRLDVDLFKYGGRRRFTLELVQVPEQGAEVDADYQLQEPDQLEDEAKRKAREAIRRRYG